MLNIEMRDVFTWIGRFYAGISILIENLVHNDGFLRKLIFVPDDFLRSDVQTKGDISTLDDPIQRVLEIDEILETIFLHGTNISLKNCRLVCSQWNREASKVLSKKDNNWLSLRHENYQGIRRDQAENILKSSRELDQGFIFRQLFVTHWFRMLEPNFHHTLSLWGHFLRKVCLDGVRPFQSGQTPVRNYSILLTVVGKLLSQWCPNLESLEVRFIIQWGRFGRFIPEDDVQEVVGSNNLNFLHQMSVKGPLKLKYLRVFNELLDQGPVRDNPVELIVASYFVKVVLAAPSLRYLDLYSPRQIFVDKFFEALQNHPQKNFWTRSLRSVTVPFSSLMNERVKPIEFPELNSLTLTDVEKLPHHTPAQWYRSFLFPKLVSLTLMHMSYRFRCEAEGATQFLDLLRQFSGLKRLRFLESVFLSRLFNATHFNLLSNQCQFRSVTHLSLEMKYSDCMNVLAIVVGLFPCLEEVNLQNMNYCGIINSVGPEFSCLDLVRALLPLENLSHLSILYPFNSTFQLLEVTILCSQFQGLQSLIFKRYSKHENTRGTDVPFLLTKDDQDLKSTLDLSRQFNLFNLDQFNWC